MNLFTSACVHFILLLTGWIYFCSLAEKLCVYSTKAPDLWWVHLSWGECRFQFFSRECIFFFLFLFQQWSLMRSVLLVLSESTAFKSSLLLALCIWDKSSVLKTKEYLVHIACLAAQQQRLDDKVYSRNVTVMKSGTHHGKEETVSIADKPFNLRQFSALVCSAHSAVSINNLWTTVLCSHASL